MSVDEADISDIFISYSRENRDSAKLLAEYLEGQGFSVWWDVDLIPKQNFRKVIESRLDETKAALVLWSDTARDSTFVIDEAQLAQEAGKLIQITLDGEDPPLGFGRGSVQICDLSGGIGTKNEAMMQKLMAAIRSLLSGDDEVAALRMQVEALQRRVHEGFGSSGKLSLAWRSMIAGAMALAVVALGFVVINFVYPRLETNRVVRDAHQKPVYAFHGSKLFQQAFVSFPHPACAIQEHPFFKFLVEEESASMYQEVYGYGEKSDNFIAQLKDYGCEHKKTVEYGLDINQSLEIPFFARQSVDDVYVEIFISHAAWAHDGSDENDEESEDGDHVLRIVQPGDFKVLLDDNVLIDNLNQTDLGSAVFAGSITSKLEDQSANKHDFHILKIQLDENLLVSKYKGDKAPVAHVKAIIYLNRRPEEQAK